MFGVRSSNTKIVGYYRTSVRFMANQNMSSQRDPVRAFRIPDDLYNDLRVASKAEDLNLSQAVRRAIKDWTENPKGSN